MLRLLLQCVCVTFNAFFVSSWQLLFWKWLWREIFTDLHVAAVRTSQFESGFALIVAESTASECTHLSVDYTLLNTTDCVPASLLCMLSVLMFARGASSPHPILLNKYWYNTETQSCQCLCFVQRADRAHPHPLFTSSTHSCWSYYSCKEPHWQKAFPHFLDHCPNLKTDSIQNPNPSSNLHSNGIKL